MKNKALQLLLSLIIFFAVGGCEEEDLGDKRIPVGEVSLSLAETRVNSDHPTMISPEYRKDFVLAISIGEQKEIYVNKDGKWVPDKEPVYFPDEKTPQDIYFECYYLYPLTDENQNTFDKIQQRDSLVGIAAKQVPTNGLKNVTLKHKNSIIEVRLSNELVNKGNVYINNTVPYKYSSNIYHLVVNKTQEISSIPFLIENNEGESYDCDLYLPTSELLENSLYTFLLMLGYNVLEVESAITLSEWNIQEEEKEVFNPEPIFMSLKIEGLDTKNKIILNRENLRKERITYNEEFQSYRIFYFKDEQTGYEPTLSFFTIENDTLGGREYDLGIKYEPKSEIRLELAEDGNVILKSTTVSGGTYYISSIEELKLVREHNRNDFRQERDLYFNHSSIFQDHNNFADIFYGTYDGNSKTMYNISLDNISDRANDSYSRWGLFRECQNAKITNLTIENLTVKDERAGNNVQYIGGLAGYCSASKIQSCTIKNSSIFVRVRGTNMGGMVGYAENKTLLNQLSIDNLEISSDNSADKENIITSMGGIVGYSTSLSQIQNCTIKNSNITTKGNLYTGGIAGYASFITNSTITRSTIQADKNFAGGVIAYVGEEGSVNNCRSEDINLNILKTNQTEIADTVYVGGIIGRYTSSTDKGGVVSCSAIRNTITSEKTSVCGGIAGSVIHQNAIMIRECESIDGTVSSTYISGGICGECYAENPASVDINHFFTFMGCTNSSQVQGNQYVGGICARNEGSRMVACRNSGEVGSSTVEYSGGICGLITFYNNNSSIEYCTNSGIVNGLTAGGIFGRCQLDNEFKKQDLTYLIFGCTNEAKIQGDQYAGGICGIVDYIGVDIVNSKNWGDVVAKYCAGGICAKNERNPIHLCTNSGKVETTEDNATGSGGICGLVTLYDASDKRNFIPMEIKECTNWGTIDGYIAGGICGLFEGTLNQNQLAQENVTVSFNDIINYGTIDSKKFKEGTSGGIIGSIPLKNGNIRLSKSYNLGNVIGTDDNTNIGSIVGVIEIIKNTASGSKVQINQCYVEIPAEYIKALLEDKKNICYYFFGKIIREFYDPLSLSEVEETVININDIFYAMKEGKLDENKLIGFYHSGIRRDTTSTTYVQEATSLKIEAQRIPPFTAPNFLN
jgi:hypothetical protein